MSSLDVGIKSYDTPGKDAVSYQVDITREYQKLADGIELRILGKIADKYIEDHYDEIISMIDMDRLGQQINGKILGAALAKLAEDSESSIERERYY